MKAIAIVLVYAVAICAGVPFPNVKNFGERIIGGENATEDYPYMASIRYINFVTHSCGGSIITRRTILTAAHCVFYTNAANVYVVVGTNFLDRGGVGYSAQSLIHHADYNETDIQNDVGLVIVNRNIEYTPRIQPIEFTDEIIGGNLNAFVIGWGVSTINGSLSNTLQYLSTTVLTNENCARQMNEAGIYIFSSSLCIFSAVGQSVCNSDSGGPIVVNQKLVGIVSWGRGCAGQYPDVCARVSSYYQWINNNKV